MSFVKRAGAACLAGLILGLAASPALAARWKVDPARSRLTFEAGDSGQPFVGVFQSWNAEIDFDPARLDAASVTIIVDVASLDAKDPVRNGHLPTEAWFNVERFPKAQFTARRFNRLADGSYEAVGELSIRGVARPLKLPFTVVFNGDQAHAQGAADLVRTDFALGDGVEDDRATLAVKIRFEVFAEAAK